MKVQKTKIEGVLLIHPDVYNDERGYFFESFSEREFNENVEKIDFVQDNQSKSCYGVVRGLHFQKGEYAQSKLVRCVKGEILEPYKIAEIIKASLKPVKIPSSYSE